LIALSYSNVKILFTIPEPFTAFQTMTLIDWFANRQKPDPTIQTQQEREIADGLWTKCDPCGAIAYTKDLKANQMVCLECEHHRRVTCEERIAQLIDSGTWQSLDDHIMPTDPLKFVHRKPYIDQLKETQDKTGLTDAVATGSGLIEGHGIALGVMDFRFMGGSMGSVVGEKLARVIEYGTSHQLPVVILCASGGARMQEGMLSLMQMAKISAALARHQKARLLYIPVLTNPTMGGVIASFAMLGDIILAEPKATIGFAGRRVIEQTLREKLPKLRATLAQLVRLHQPQENTSRAKAS
jgi:acetyl-CoA carboxylase carboxyl transferase subunit beta